VLVAVDTNVLIDQALGDRDVVGALAIIRKRLPRSSFIVPPTVLEELAWAADHAPEQEIKDACLHALRQLTNWNYQPLNVIPVGHGIVEQISFKLRTSGILPEDEENDASIIAEAALLGCVILLSSDRHFIDAQEHPDFRQLLKDCEVDGDNIVIARPRIIVEKFFREM